jgi:nucleoside-diphosphate-sugar epimerase
MEKMNETNRIAIIGTNSYIGSNFLVCYEKETVETISSLKNEWQTADFTSFDTLFHVAGIAHVSTDPSMENLYYEINRDLPIAVAQKAKAEGVKHFVFLSSMIVYGDDLPIGQESVITLDTLPNPANFYGKSKLQAEEGLLALQDDSFAVSIIRLPMVYGEGCKGNFPKLVALAQKVPIFPALDNQRSMIYIGNLCAYLKMVIDTRMTGILFPQNTKYVSTLDIVRQAARLSGHKVFFTRIFNPLLTALSRKVGVLRKLFGSKVYSRSLSPDLESYNIYTFEQSMERYFANLS